MDASLELGKNLVTIVCGHHAIIYFFSRTFPAFCLVLFLAWVCCSGSNCTSSWPFRLALIPLLFIVRSVKLVTHVMPSQLDGELHEVRDNQ